MRKPCGRDDEEMEERVWRILDALGLMEVANNTPGMIDLGKRRRVALARAAVLRPEVLLFDQPLVGLNYRQQGWWRDLISELSLGHEIMGDKPVTVVVTTANFWDWLDHARKFALLGHGVFKVVGDRKRMQACDDPIARELLETEQSTN